MKNNDSNLTYTAPLCKIFNVHTQGVICESFNPNTIEGFSEDNFVF